jgi:hypothetical protein
VKKKSFVPNFFWKTAKYHVSKKRPGSYCFWSPLATVGNFDINLKKKIKMVLVVVVKKVDPVICGIQPVIFLARVGLRIILVFEDWGVVALTLVDHHPKSWLDACL